MKEIQAAVGGPPGTGTTELARSLAKILPLVLGIQTKNPIEVFSSGNICRVMATQAGLTLEEFQELMKNDKSYDRIIDEEVRLKVSSTNHFIVDSRLGHLFAGSHVFKIRLTCSSQQAAKRVQADRLRNARVDESKSTKLYLIQKEMRDRRNSENERYKELYPGYKENYNVDLVINTTKLTQFEVLRIAYHAFLQWYTQ